MIRRWLLAVAVVVLGISAASAAISALSARPAVQTIKQPGRLVIVSMPTLTFDGANSHTTPALWAMARTGAVAALTTRNLTAHSCSNQSWLTFGAGSRTTIGQPVGETPTGARPGTCSPELQPVQDGEGAYYPDWATWRASAPGAGTTTDLGLVASSLEAHGQCLMAAGKYVALGAADRTGRIAHYQRSVDDVSLTTCPVTLIGLDGPDDRYLSQLLARLPAKTTLVVTGAADDTTPESLRAVAIIGPRVRHGLATSASTRQVGLLQTTDLSALTLSRIGSAAPTLPEGRAPVVQPTGSPTAPVVRVTQFTTALQIEHAFVLPFFVCYLGGTAIACAIGGVWWWLSRTGFSRGLRRYFAGTAAVVAATPVATLLVGFLPWWRADQPRVVLGIFTFAGAVFIAAAALLGPWGRYRRGPTVFLGAFTLVVLGLDVVHGSALQLTSLTGLQPVYGGRFYGMGNVSYAFYATCGLLVAASLAGALLDRGARPLAVLTVLLIGAAVVVVDGYPGWGADGGGTAALIPAFAYLALNAAGRRVTWRRILLILVVSGAFVLGLAFLDYLRPAQNRTHLGDFMAGVIHDGSAGPLARIWQANWTMLVSSPVNLLVPVLLVLAIIALGLPNSRLGRPLRPLFEQVTFYDRGLAAAAVCWLIGFVSNDSGTAIPPAGLLMAIPLTVLLAASPAWRLDDVPPGATTPERRVAALR
ncbi:hypothetical protein [Branchiibius cervicis]|uniref:Uncharacterized protein n=1 Tax=Branchiibius cervicis TaxID=908252 RepID=A0ABW2AYC2_9MICO